jgi:hypothetical protein
VDHRRRKNDREVLASGDPTARALATVESIRAKDGVLLIAWTTTPPPLGFVAVRAERYNPAGHVTNTNDLFAMRVFDLNDMMNMIDAMPRLVGIDIIDLASGRRMSGGNTRRRRETVFSLRTLETAGVETIPSC